MFQILQKNKYICKFKHRAKAHFKYDICSTKCYTNALHITETAGDVAALRLSAKVGKFRYGDIADHEFTIR